MIIRQSVPVRNACDTFLPQHRHLEFQKGFGSKPFRESNTLPGAADPRAALGQSHCLEGVHKRRSQHFQQLIRLRRCKNNCVQGFEVGGAISQFVFCLLEF